MKNFKEQVRRVQSSYLWRRAVIYQWNSNCWFIVLILLNTKNMSGYPAEDSHVTVKVSSSRTQLKDSGQYLNTDRNAIQGQRTY